MNRIKKFYSKIGGLIMLSNKARTISPSPTLAIDAKFKQMKANGEDVVGFGCGQLFLRYTSGGQRACCQ